MFISVHLDFSSVDFTRIFLARIKTGIKKTTNSMYK